MAARVKVKTPKVVKATLGNKDVIDMFQGILGTSDDTSPNLAITFEKYTKMRNHTERFLKVLSAFNASKTMSFFPDYDLTAYIAKLKEGFATSFPVITMPVTKEEVDVFSAIFKHSKKCNIVNIVIVCCKNLIQYKQSLNDIANLKDKFILKTAGSSICPLPDSSLNIKHMYIDDRISADDKNFILVILHKLMTIGHDLYEALSSPDVNVDEFVEVIMSSIAEVKKHIPRCDQAFQKILDSVDMLKSNFNGYYKDFTVSGNATIIMENFVLDVSKNTNSSPAVTAQFRKIIAHYRKIASQRSAHPKLQTLFNQVDANFQELEKRSKMGNKEEEYDSDEADADVANVDDTNNICSDGNVDNANNISSSNGDAKSSLSLIDELMKDNSIDIYDDNRTNNSSDTNNID
jgi:hypothetical protein